MVMDSWFLGVLFTGQIHTDDLEEEVGEPLRPHAFLRAQARRQGRGQCLLRILEKRGIESNEHQLDQLRCGISLDQFDHYFERAMTQTSAWEVFRASAWSD